MSEKVLAKHVSEGKKRFINRVVLELKGLVEKVDKGKKEAKLAS